MNRTQDHKLFPCVANSVTDCKETFWDASEYHRHFAREHAKESGFEVTSNSNVIDNATFVCALRECTSSDRTVPLPISWMVGHYTLLHRSILEICQKIESDSTIVKPWQVGTAPVSNSPSLFNPFPRDLLIRSEAEVMKSFDRAYDSICNPTK